MHLLKFSKIDIDDPFFDSLKNDYPEFVGWFQKKSASGASAFVHIVDNTIQAFLYLKIEREELSDITPVRPACKRLKVGTFKINAHNTKLGERFIKKIVDAAAYAAVEEIYLTIFPKHIGLIRLLKRYGFEQAGSKYDELVLVKSFKALTNDRLKDYPLISLRGKRKFLLSIYPKFHSVLFPDSILNNEEHLKYELIKDVSHTNSIHKIYLCSIKDTAGLIPGDLIAIYRTSDMPGHARFRSVVTSVCQVEEIKTKSCFSSVEDFLSYTNYYSVFNEDSLKGWFRSGNFVVIKMTYNLALKKRVTRGYMLDEIGIQADRYWGFFQLTDHEFNKILEKGGFDESLVID